MQRIINPRYAARVGRIAPPPTWDRPARKVEIGPATLYHGDCFDVMPTLTPVGAAVTDPPYGIGYEYRSYDDAPANYHSLMSRLVPELTRLTTGGPCFVWQSPMKADQWHRYFPTGYRIIPACKRYARPQCLSWDPIIFWSRHRVSDVLPRDWLFTDLTATPYPKNSPVPCPRPLNQVSWIVRALSAESVLDPFLGSGTTGVACVIAGKRFVGIEQDPVYFDYACQRIEAAYQSLTTRGTSL